MSDILDAIDAAIGCQQCGGPLGASPSDDFCGEGCQRTWAAARVGHAPVDHCGIGQVLTRPQRDRYAVASVSIVASSLRRYLVRRSGGYAEGGAIPAMAWTSGILARNSNATSAPVDVCGNDCFGPEGHRDGCPVHCGCYDDGLGW